MAEHIIYLLGPYSIPGFDGERNVRVYLPKEGAQADASPVLYLFDGQNIFHDDPSYCGGWRLHEAVRDLVGRDLVAPVLVGVDHGGSGRIHELSPFRGDGSEGRLDTFLDWLAAELVPQVQRRFAVRCDPAGTAIGGASLGGLAALYAHFHRDDVFGAALCMSPSLWVAGGEMFRFVASRPLPQTSRLYVDAGAKEDGGAVLRNAERLVQHLRERGYGEEALHWCPDEDGTHGEEAWRRRAPAALQFLFSGVSQRRAAAPPAQAQQAA